MIQGSVDGLDRHLFSGWAYDTASPDQAVTVSVFLGEELIVQTQANSWRSDLADAGIGNGHHAFLHPFPQPMAEDQLSQVKVIAAGARLPINGSPAEKPSDAFFLGSIERLDSYGVAGWAYNKAAPSHAVNVVVMFGDRWLGALDADLHRTDLETANIGDGRHAFRYAFPEEIAEDQLANISVLAGGRVALARASTLEPFHSLLGAVNLSSGIGRIWSRAHVFPVVLRRTFDISGDSIIGRLMRLQQKERPLTADQLNPILSDLCESVKSSVCDRVHLEKLTVHFADRIEKLEVSRLNSNFVSVDCAVHEFRQGYEPEIQASIDLFVPDHGVLLDIGSNWGYFAISLATRPGFSGQIFAFEPSSQSFQDLTKLVERLKLKDSVVCEKIGLADYSGSAQLSVGLFSGLSSIADSVAENYGVGHEEVQISRLDDLNLPDSHLMKIDVEGVEASVIRGGEQHIRRAKPAIVLENWIFPADLKRTHEPLEILQDWGYQFYFPCWTNVEKSLFSSMPIGEERRQLLALCPFELDERTFLDARVNVVALPKERPLRGKT